VSKYECILLPSIPASIFPDNTEWVLEVTPVKFAEMLYDFGVWWLSIISYIRHEPTMRAIKQYAPATEIIQVTSGEYSLERYRRGDLIFVIGLRKRAPTSGADVEVTIDDLKILMVRARRKPQEPL